MNEQEIFLELIEKTMEKREFKGLAKPIIIDSIKKYLKKSGINLSTQKELSERDKKLIIKGARSELRLSYGRFQSEIKKREPLLKKNNIEELLQTHSSTKERISSYPEIIKSLHDLKPNSILDLGCGLNPLAMSTLKVKYYAADISEEELSLVNEYFKKNKIDGKTFFYDLNKFDESTLPEADVCLIFKVLDIIKKNNPSIIRKIISGVKCKHLIVSFSTKKLSGRAMSMPKRIWFESMLRNLNYPCRTLKTDNEIFYFIDKN